MRRSALSVAFTFAALVAFALTPIPAEAGSRDHRGFYLEFGSGGFAWHDGGLRYAKRHPQRSHYNEYRSYERQLRSKRDRLLANTEQALSHGDFAKAQVRLAKLIEVDDRLQEHHAAHASCHH
jgi:hypothetical protein